MYQGGGGVGGGISHWISTLVVREDRLHCRLIFNERRKASGTTGLGLQGWIYI